MVKAKILVVEDDSAISNLIRTTLETQNYQYHTAKTGSGALLDAVSYRPDVIILDLGLPDIDGVEIIQKVRSWTNTPIIVVSARSEDQDKVDALDAGADDYITKPFSPKELVARIKAVMRRISPMAVEEVIEMQGLSLDPSSHRVMTGENPLDMGPTEFKLLHFFMTHPERVYSREQLLNHVWGTNVYVEDRTVDVHIRRLRKALEHSGHDRMVQTVRGTGYRFSARF